MPFEQRDSPVKLFREQYPCEAVGERQGGQCQRLIRRVLDPRIETIRAAYDEGHIRTVSHPGGHRLSKLNGRYLPAAFIEDHHVTSAGKRCSNALRFDIQ